MRLRLSYSYVLVLRKSWANTQFDEEEEDGAQFDDRNSLCTAFVEMTHGEPRYKEPSAIL